MALPARSSYTTGNSLLEDELSLRSKTTELLQVDEVVIVACAVPTHAIFELRTVVQALDTDSDVCTWHKSLNAGYERHDYESGCAARPQDTHRQTPAGSSSGQGPGQGWEAGGCWLGYSNATQGWVAKQ